MRNGGHVNQNTEVSISFGHDTAKPAVSGKPCGPGYVYVDRIIANGEEVPNQEIFQTVLNVVGPIILQRNQAATAPEPAAPTQVSNGEPNNDSEAAALPARYARWAPLYQTDLEAWELTSIGAPYAKAIADAIAAQPADDRLEMTQYSPADAQFDDEGRGALEFWFREKYSDPAKKGVLIIDMENGAHTVCLSQATQYTCTPTLDTASPLVRRIAEEHRPE